MRDIVYTLKILQQRIIDFSTLSLRLRQDILDVFQSCHIPEDPSFFQNLTHLFDSDWYEQKRIEDFVQKQFNAIDGFNDLSKEVKEQLIDEKSQHIKNLIEEKATNKEKLASINQAFDKAKEIVEFDRDHHLLNVDEKNEFIRQMAKIIVEGGEDRQELTEDWKQAYHYILSEKIKACYERDLTRSGVYQLMEPTSQQTILNQLVKHDRKISLLSQEKLSKNSDKKFKPLQLVSINFWFPKQRKDRSQLDAKVKRHTIEIISIYLDQLGICPPKLAHRVKDKDLGVVVAEAFDLGFIDKLTDIFARKPLSEAMRVVEATFDQNEQVIERHQPRLAKAVRTVRRGRQLFNQGHFNQLQQLLEDAAADGIDDLLSPFVNQVRPRLQLVEQIQEFLLSGQYRSAYKVFVEHPEFVQLREWFQQPIMFAVNVLDLIEQGKIREVDARVRANDQLMVTPMLQPLRGIVAPYLKVLSELDQAIALRSYDLAMQVILYPPDHLKQAALKFRDVLPQLELGKELMAQFYLGDWRALQHLIIRNAVLIKDSLLQPVHDFIYPAAELGEKFTLLALNTNFKSAKQLILEPSQRYQKVANVFYPAIPFLELGNHIKTLYEAENFVALAQLFKNNADKLQHALLKPYVEQIQPRVALFANAVEIWNDPKLTRLGKIARLAKLMHLAGDQNLLLFMDRYANDFNRASKVLRFVDVCWRGVNWLIRRTKDFCRFLVDGLHAIKRTPQTIKHQTNSTLLKIASQVSPDVHQSENHALEQTKALVFTTDKSTNTSAEKSTTTPQDHKLRFAS